MNDGNAYVAYNFNFAIRYYDLRYHWGLDGRVVTCCIYRPIAKQEILDSIPGREQRKIN